MDKNKYQIFQSSHRTRWNCFLWIAGSLGALIIFGFIILGFSVLKTSNPEFYDDISINEQKRLPKIDSFNKTLKEPVKSISSEYKTKRNIKLSSRNISNDWIRAGFYVNWDKTSFTTLEDFGGSMNMIFPEWFFINEKSDTVFQQIDTAGLRLMKDFRLEIVPVISNYSKGFNPANVRKIMNSPAKRQVFINNLVRIMDKYKFFGINIDFEEMTSSDNNILIQFLQELHQAFSKKNYVITMDISPENLDLNLIKKAQEYCDYFVLMAYDQHNSLDTPGPVSAHKWTENLIDSIGQFCNLQNFILGIAGYGYDWPQGKHGKSISYMQALTLAKQNNSKIWYNNDTYNLNFEYLDDSDKVHTVYFLDAASNFNAIRQAEDFGMAGVALWRLGVEDQRLWNYYERRLSRDSLHRFPLQMKDIEELNIQDNINYAGTGDILNINSIPSKGKIKIAWDTEAHLIAEEEYLKLPTTCLVNRKGYADHKLVITFDDGPDPYYTSKILEILRWKKVPAVFFIIGLNAENHLSLVKKIYDEGHEIGNHTFTHPNINKIGYDRFKLELNATRRIIESATGHSTILFRTPYNTTYNAVDYEDMIPVKWAKDQNYFCVTESIGSYDWKQGFNKDSILKSVSREINMGSVMIFHDGGGDRKATLNALPEIIDYYRAKGYEFVSLAELIGKDRNYIMPEIKSTTDIFLSRINRISINGTYMIIKILFNIFQCFIILSILRCVIISLLAFIDKKSTKHKTFPDIPESHLPKVSVIVPAFNEETGIVSNINNLLKIEYPNFEIIVVDDGSTDNTFELVRKTFKNNLYLHVYKKENGGKASALNYGVKKSTGEILVCIDADTQLNPSAIRTLVRHFIDPKVGAVAGNVKIGNERNILSKWQSIEYITSQNFDRRAFDLLNCIIVVPGAIGAFRRQAVIRCGMYATNTMAEDCDITINMIRKGYKVITESSALAYTEVPQTTKMLLRQRLRWNYGILQSFWKHRGCILNPKHKALGFVALPNIIVFQILMPLIAPIADIMLLFSFIFGNFSTVLLYYILFIVFEFITSAIAFSFEKEDISKLIYLLPQKFYYRQLMYYVSLLSLLRAVRGGKYSWERIKRSGIVDIA